MKRWHTLVERRKKLRTLVGRPKVRHNFALQRGRADSPSTRQAAIPTQVIMSTSRSALLGLLAVGMLLFGGCATLQERDPVNVILVGVEPLTGEGLEFRILVKLRIQNPNDVPLDFNGVSVRLDVQGKRFATGVSDAAVSVPRFGETIVDLPVSISVFQIARQTISVITNEYRGKLPYEITGKLAGPVFGSMRFKSQGEFTLPAELFEGGK